MSESPKFSPDAQRYLDGEPGHPPDARERAGADRLARAAAAYAAQLRVPGPELDAAVMHRIRAEPPGGSANWWSWLLAAHVVRVRPAVLALAASLALLVWWKGIAPRPAGPVAVAAPAEETVLVRFQLAAPEAHDVTLAGSFNGWTPGIALRRSVVPGLWVVTVPLSVGEHQYLFRVDGTKWIADPGAHAQVDDGFGRTNSVLVVGPRGVAGP